ncbi:MAG: hypothetical protein ACRDSN_00330 [Pseudonocardiaceae bacterium]
MLVTITLDTTVGTLYEDGEPAGTVSVGDLVIDKAADQLVGKVGEDLRKAVLDQFRDEIVSQVAAVVADVIAKPVQLTNTWGEPTGKTTSVREHIAEEVERQLRPHNSNWAGRDKPLLQKLIEVAVVNALTTELSGAIREARDKVVGKVHDHAAELIAGAVKDGLR